MVRNWENTMKDLEMSVNGAIACKQVNAGFDGDDVMGLRD